MPNRSIAYALDPIPRCESFTYLDPIQIGKTRTYFLFTYSDPFFSFYLFGSVFFFLPFRIRFFLFTFLDPFFSFCFFLPFWISFFIFLPFRIVRMTEKARIFHLTASPSQKSVGLFLKLHWGSEGVCQRFPRGPAFFSDSER